jgi:hypothetical protein
MGVYFHDIKAIATRVAWLALLCDLLRPHSWWPLYMSIMIDNLHNNSHLTRKLGPKIPAAW